MQPAATLGRCSRCDPLTPDHRWIDTLDDTLDDTSGVSPSGVGIHHRPATPGHTDAMTDPDPVPSGGPTLSLAEAVDRCSVSRATLQRRLRAGEIEGATRNRSGGWEIPISGLIAAGLIPRTTPADPVTPSTSEVPTTEVALLQAAAEIAVLRAERDAARELAEERAQRIEDLRAALDAERRALNPGTSPDPTPTTTEPEPIPADPVTPSTSTIPGRFRRIWRSRR